MLGTRWSVTTANPQTVLRRMCTFAARRHSESCQRLAMLRTGSDWMRDSRGAVVALAASCAWAAKREHGLPV